MQKKETKWLQIWEMQENAEKMQTNDANKMQKNAKNTTQNDKKMTAQNRNGKQMQKHMTKKWETNAKKMQNKYFWFSNVCRPKIFLTVALH